MREVVLFDPAGADLAAEDHLPKARALFFEERDDPQREVEVVFGCEPTHLQRDDDAKGAVPLAAVAVRIAGENYPGRTPGSRAGEFWAMKLPTGS